MLLEHFFSDSNSQKLCDLHSTLPFLPSLSGLCQPKSQTCLPNCTQLSRATEEYTASTRTPLKHLPAASIHVLFHEAHSVLMWQLHLISDNAPTTPQLLTSCSPSVRFRKRTSGSICLFAVKCHVYCSTCVYLNLSVCLQLWSFLLGFCLFPHVWPLVFIVWFLA